MDLATLLNLPSLAPQLAHTGRRNGRRTGFDWLTLHYNGPSVAAAGNPDGEIKQLQIDAQFHIDKVWGHDGATPLHGQRIMYDLAVLSDGSAYVLGDPDDLLWHCGNAIGNAQSYALHLPIGGVQDVTEPQWQTTIRIYEQLAEHHGWPGTSRLVGHCEWPRKSNDQPVLSTDIYRVQPEQSMCPGVNIATRMIAYRTGLATHTPAATVQAFVVIDPCSTDPASNFANVRQAPALAAAIACQLAPGTPVLIDSISGGWAHLATANPFRDLGFVAVSLLRKAA
jgi:hypothetical protein